MKKLIIIFLSIFIAIPNAHAADEDFNNYSCETNYDGSCPPGCGINDLAYGCTSCGIGKYNPHLTNRNACEEECDKPGDAIFTNVPEAYGNKSNYCPWELTCKAGQYWDGGKCSLCGNWIGDGNYSGYFTIKTCTISSRGTDRPDSNRYDICDGKVYKLYLTKNRRPNSDKTITLYYKYSTGFAKIENPEKWLEILPDRHSDTLFKKLTGYHTNKDCSNGSLVFSFNEDGELALTSTGWSSLGGDKTLYACWDKLTQTIIYRDEDNNQIGQPQSCTAEEDEEFVCPARDCTLDDGVVFSKYECTYLDKNGSEQYCEQRFLGIGDTIPPLGNATIYLTIQTDPCPAGHYCEAGTQTSCPGGSTSDTGATGINKCYMDEGTQFCDSVGCFNLDLPDNTKIYYHGGD